MPNSVQRSILALVGSASSATVARAAAQLNATVKRVRSESSLLSALHAAPQMAVMLSLDDVELPTEILERVATHPHCASLILCTQAITLERSFLTERVGAVALLREPLQLDEVIHHLGSATADGVEVPLPDPAPESDLPLMIGSGPVMAPVFETLARVSNSTATVLVTGESGTGKEVVARVLHAASDRKNGPFVAVNCAAIPEQLLESELFGHARGAFTGAVAQRTGRFEMADGGTLFLDEIGDMSLVLQAKVLRVLEERTLDPVGSDKPVAVDVRVVAATNQDLTGRIASGAFREDLYYRLAVVEVDLPPLRERGADVRSLALHFAAEFARRHGRKVEAISEAALHRLETYSWPGNVRELRNVIDRAVVLSTGPVLHSGALRLGAGSPRASARRTPSDEAAYPTSMTLAEVEAAHIARVLTAANGHMGNAAERLGIHRNTLTRKVRDYGLDAPTDPVA